MTVRERRRKKSESVRFVVLAERSSREKEDGVGGWCSRGMVRRQGKRRCDKDIKERVWEAIGLQNMNFSTGV